MSEKEDIIRLHDDGFSLRDIERKTGIPKSTVGRWVKQEFISENDEIIDEPILKDEDSKKSIGLAPSNSVGQWIAVFAGILLIVWVLSFLWSYKQ